MALDVEITQSDYWGGSQIPYWLYMLFVIFPVTGILGVDHLLLRSPMTALLKFLSFVPLFGFWYFYDIAQLGEGSTIKENGIGIPFYGPGNIGKGMFHAPGKKPSPDTVPRPWAFAGYVLTSIIFLAFPINKLIIGDYYGALAQLCMLIFAPLAIAWSIYDIYRVMSHTRDVMEKEGTARIPPATFFMDGYFKKALDVLGPKPSEPDAPGFFGIIESAVEAPIVAVGKGAAGVVDGAVGVVKAAEGTVSSGIGAVGSFFNAFKAIGNALTGSAKAVSTVSAVTSGAPRALTKAVAQAGGYSGSNDPSSTTVVVLFGVAFLAFSGYAYTAMRKIRMGTVEKDDSPPTVKYRSQDPSYGGVKIAS